MPPSPSIPNHPPATLWTLPGLPRRCSGSISPLSTHPWSGTALGAQMASDEAHEWTGMCRGVFHSTRSGPSSYKSLFSPAKGKTLSGDQGIQGGPQLEVGGGCPCLPLPGRPSEPAWRRADSGQFTLDWVSQEPPSPAHTESPKMRCAGCLPRNKLTCVSRRLSSPHCHISPLAPQGHSGRRIRPSCYRAGRQPAAKTCL